MKEAFPEFTFIGTEQKAFDVRLLNVPVVFVCPGYLSHAVYFRAMEAIRGTETRVVYISPTNDLLTKREIARALGEKPRRSGVFSWV